MSFRHTNKYRHLASSKARKHAHIHAHTRVATHMNPNDYYSRLDGDGHDGYHRQSGGYNRRTLLAPAAWADDDPRGDFRGAHMTNSNNSEGTLIAPSIGLHTPQVPAAASLSCVVLLRMK